ncbi:MAG TPA: 2-oxoglutarate dehydrogenase E1 component [Leucothrix mucor]|nr:2-oxoglutarate dehydrogenase E1 component [Leucothrix mucor]
MDQHLQSESDNKNIDSMLDGENAAYLELLFENYLQDPLSVSKEWQDYFSKMPVPADFCDGDTHTALRQQFRTYKLHSQENDFSHSCPDNLQDLETERQQVHVLQMIEAYRSSAHLVANTNPLYEGKTQPSLPELTLEHYNLDKVDQDKHFDSGNLQLSDTPTLGNIYRALRNTYTNSIGIEYMHIVDREEIRWFQGQLEPCQAKPKVDDTQKSKLLDQLIAAETLERYLHKKYVGQKRFSLEGGESLIPLLHELIHHSGRQKTREIVLGMAHRGRLNVLINIMGKSPDDIFKEFEGEGMSEETMGDVKYHKGFSCSIQTEQDAMHLSLAFNPSHLEIVAPVVCGSVRARQDHRSDQGGQVVAINIHGDAAFAGQGVVMETFNMSETRGYRIHGTVHVVINNQIGFTTSTQVDSRSTYYPTDVAKMINAPILHVNGDDPEAVAYVSRIALDYRLRFKKDIVIDLVCYRRHGHNEADEPAITQPTMYTAIRNKPTTRKLYAQKLISEGLISENEETVRIQDYKEKIAAGTKAVDILDYSSVPEHFKVNWNIYKDRHWTSPADTGCDLKKLRAYVKNCHAVPKHMVLHDRVAKILAKRDLMVKGEVPVDWGFAENLAYASLLAEGYHVRLSGQDSGRGTFSHRHAVLHSQIESRAWIPLRHVLKNKKNQGKVNIIDSVLSEEAVLAFEYGYATSSPNTLVIWEAQFGDFANGAQVVIDQFISSGEQKWGRLSGLTMFLPHGLEGMGAEHSSARLERFLQLCAQLNMQVCVPSTPAQIFHMLRRQMIRQYRKPLIVFTPKSLLRHPMAVNTIEELASGSFRTIIDEISERISKNKASVTRVVLCSGKVYYDLLQARDDKDSDHSHIALIRIEQLYPFQEELLEKILATYSNLKELVWCQEEARNQGAWDSIKHRFRHYEDKYNVVCMSRPSAAAPAVGSLVIHKKQQAALIAEAMSSQLPKNIERPRKR